MTVVNRASVINAVPKLAALGLAPLNSSFFRKVDPYLKWALITDFEGYRGLPSGQVPFLIRTVDDRKVASQFLPSIAINGAYVEFNDDWSEYATALVDKNTIVRLHEEIVNKRNGACKLGLPGSQGVQTAPPAAAAGGGGELFFGIIDHGIAFAHRSFSNAAGGGTRVRSLWDQDPNSVKRTLNPNVTWDENTLFKYGAVITSNSINNAQTAFSETELYAGSGYKPVEKRLSHGTHVLDLASGRDNGPNGLRFNDAASAAQIYAVQLPWQPYKDTSGASLCVHILDGLKWISLNVGGGVPIVVNISDGAYAGPNKGRSLLERAMDDMLKPVPTFGGGSAPAKMRLVLAAGNGARRRGHAAGELGGRQSSGEIGFQVLPDTPTDTMLEIWVDSASDLSSYSDEVSLKLISPTGETCIGNLSADLTGFTNAAGLYIAMLNTSDQSPDCPNTLGFVIAISPTRKSSSMIKRAQAPHGVWSIEVVNDSTENMSFSAQIQRSNPALGDRGGCREAKFSKAGAGASYVTSNETLNNIATGSYPVTVGGCLASGDSWPNPANPSHREVEVEYSSRGSNVCVAAPSDYSLGLHGVLSAGNRSGTTARMDGTSVAAPQVARALLNALAIPANVNVDNATLLGTLTTAAQAGVMGPPKLN
jgi:hypothetical protein